MDKLQFNIDEDSLYSPISPDVVDISGGSEDAFSIQPGDRVQLEERFRINPAGSNLMSAFVGAATASLFPNMDTTLEHDAVSGLGNSIGKRSHGDNWRPSARTRKFLNFVHR